MRNALDIARKHSMTLRYAGEFRCGEPLESAASHRLEVRGAHLDFDQLSLHRSVRTECYGERIVEVRLRLKRRIEQNHIRGARDGVRDPNGRVARYAPIAIGVGYAVGSR